MNMEKKVALYARVSTERQEQAGTIESQVAELESYALEQGYQLAAEMIFLESATCTRDLANSSFNRPRISNCLISFLSLS